MPTARFSSFAALAQIPLRYRIVYRSSRSVVCDDVQQYAQYALLLNYSRELIDSSTLSRFPLFSKNVEVKHFECATILLNKNIEHVRVLFFCSSCFVNKRSPRYSSC